MKFNDHTVARNIKKKTKKANKQTNKQKKMYYLSWFQSRSRLKMERLLGCYNDLDNQLIYHYQKKIRNLLCQNSKKYVFAISQNSLQNGYCSNGTV